MVSSQVSLSQGLKQGGQKFQFFLKSTLVGVRGIIGIPINRDAVWKRYVSRYGLVVSVHSGIFVSFRKSK